MNRRRFLQIGASTGAIGLLAGCLGGASTDDPTDTDSPTDDPSEQPDQTPSPSPTDSPANATDDQGGESGDESITTPDENEETAGSDGDHQTATPDDGDSGSGEQAWSAGGEMNGVAFEFTSRAPTCGQGTDDANVEFQPEEGQIVVKGIRRGSDLCKRAQLGDVSHDTDADRLAVSVDAVDREECEDGGVGGQCLVDIPYEATFSFEDDIPSEVAISHGDRFGMSAAYGSSSATPPEE
ncbi:membrane lipoprotein [Halorhabdus tiamatea SARL4B]|uniref:Membrane lipoprotein n=1 Tax=Halorhabdus tiamatea SARL4B TaxID=1033806 RepID=F7PPZ7_9EURY|nr:twin-arginine translocation signal domain-containing protein [Halorhabdus tiamatea]ERJ07342.1 membrane lipoprotein [Halorhabdus tiamatea SARL4B]CCQ34119.1 conserved hypothetical protein [Halorhabdus tiamatea SARL4B]